MRKYINILLLTMTALLFSCENKNEDVLSGIFSEGELANATIASVDSITNTEATLTCIITYAGRGHILERGICWSAKNTSPTLDDNTMVIENADTTLVKISELTPATIYYARPYITNTKGTGYGDPISFTTKTIPSLSTTVDYSSIKDTSAIVIGNVTNDGGSAIIARGVCWSTSQNPTIELSTKTTNGTGTGEFSAILNGLVPGTTYYVRAYATNIYGTSYGNELTLQTLLLPTITTTPVTNITALSAVSGGSMLIFGNTTVIAKGICWNTVPEPTIELATKTNEGLGTNSFSSTMVNLQPSTKYYVRAYVTTLIGTAYGLQVTFSTNGLASITTSAISSLTSTSAVSGGSIASDGGAAITSRGVCWSTASNPTIALSTKTSNGSGTGTFTSSITGLAPGNTYYVRAYATNSAGTSYGNEVSFQAGSNAPVVSTSSISAITSTTATGGGNITSDGGATITARGVCWSTASNPTISLNTKTSNGSGTGSFSSKLTGLTAGVLYYVRAYATNTSGTSYGTEEYFTTLSNVPVVTTFLSSITSTTALGGGNVSSDGGALVTARGVCWSTTSNPTISLSTKTTNGTGTGTFSSALTGLTPGTTYYMRAYATNLIGTSYGNEVSFQAGSNAPVVTTSAISSITSTTATGGGNITSEGGASITARGVCWSISSNPTIALSTKTTDGTDTGTYSSLITGLSPSTLYYVRAYTTNSVGTSYGNEVSFTTGSNPPVLTTLAISSITSTTAISGGKITSDGGAAVTTRGLCWSTTSKPTIALSTKTSNGTGIGTFSSALTGLTPGTTYYVRSYATNSTGTSYGNEVTFITSAILAEITTTAISSITSTTANSGGNISSDGGATITSRGVCWSTTSNPTISLNTKTSNGSGTGSFSSSITGLTPGTSYYVRAYATNSVGTNYGNEVSFKAGSNPPVVTTSAISSITSTTAKSGGNITSDGGASITARGVCWSTTSNPTIALSTKTADGTGTGTFSSSITGLVPGTNYYLRAYATNSNGTSYGNEMSFNSNSNIPEVTTSAISSITSSSATSGGNITSDWGATVTARGVCWSTTSNPTINNTKTSDGSGIGSFTSSITGLSENTTYYARAYATNSVGTAYGTQVIFTTNTAKAACGAYVAPGVWKEFMCHNLGANTSLDPMTYSDGINGDLYQWGRPADGHQKRTSTTTTTLATSNAPGHSSFILNSSSSPYDWRSGGGNDTRWTDATKAANDPCPTGFKVPSQAQWKGVVANNTQGTWKSGYKFGDKLFLPGTGSRNGSDGSLDGVIGMGGNYWGSTVGGTSAYYLLLSYNYVGVTNGLTRSYGYSVRCVAEDEAVITIPVLATNATSNIATTTATSGGNATSDGGATVTARGVCWSTTSNPTIALSTKTSNGSGTGSFSSSITGLTAGTTYYVRAYATNSAGTAYGTQVSFTTTIPIVVPTLSTTAVSSITMSTATSGGNVTSDGGATVTARGVCWSITSNPTVSNTKTTNGSGTGAFTSSITGLVGSTTYYVRAYATNSAGTAYGAQQSFKTISTTACGAYVAPEVWKEFMCHNLGANTSLDPMTNNGGLYGDLYQWGRSADGHEKRISAITNILATSNNPGHSSFIVNEKMPFDWRSGGGNDLRWTDVTKAVNDPCPTGFKVPSQVQLAGVVANNVIGAWDGGYKFGDKLFLPASGARNYANGSLEGVGLYGVYWSSTVYGIVSHYLNLSNDRIDPVDTSLRLSGASVRCIENK